MFETEVIYVTEFPQIWIERSVDCERGKPVPLIVATDPPPGLVYVGVISVTVRAIFPSVKAELSA